MTLHDILAAAPEVTLEEMLDAREARAERQRALLAARALPLVSATLNIPGPKKAHRLAEQAFAILRALLPERLKKARFPIREYLETAGKTGFEGMYAVEGDPAAIKRAAMAIEETHPLGRIFDIDVLDRDGAQMHGADFGREGRKCILCGRPAAACARGREHSADALALRTAGLIRDCVAAEYADRTAVLAVRALLHEVLTSPKPGLVDRNNSGAHTDMNVFTFADSAAALTPYFRDMTEKGFLFEGDAGALLPALRGRGVWAEEAMYAATGGVNTHKGLIFSLGIFCAAAGWLRGREQNVSEDLLLETCAAIARETPAELESAASAGASGHEPTHGRNAYARWGLTGVRGEAAAGYPTIRRHGLPALRRAVAEGRSLESAGVFALLHILAHAGDTNVAARAGRAALAELQNEIAGFLDSAPDSASTMRFAESLDRRFIHANISPGGSADLLSLTYFLYFLA